MQKPDLSQIPADVQAYIAHLESELERLTTAKSRLPAAEKAPAEPSEPPTTINIITMSRAGLIKRTPRHHYYRQRRSGMGVFDLESPENDPPSHLASADQSETLLVITAQNRAYAIPVSDIEEKPVRGRGQSSHDMIGVGADVGIQTICTRHDSGYLAIVSERGYVRLLRHNFVGENMRSGMVLFDVARFGKIVAAGWVFDETEVFIGTKMGKGIRFAHKRTHPNGSLGIRLDPNDVPVAITGVNDDSGVFLLSHDGKGSVRLMEGFRSTKSPGAGGKVALKTEHMVAAIHVTDEDDVFCLSELGKLIRFQAVEIPPKTGTVQGVNCMSLRADACTTATISR